MKLELQMTDEMRNFLVYRGLHVLCTVNRKMELRATHYAICLVSGPNPMWGVWTVGGKLLRFHSGRDDIANHYPKLVWRRVMCQWNLINTDDKPVAQRRAYLQALLKGKLSEEDRDALDPPPVKPKLALHLENILEGSA